MRVVVALVSSAEPKYEAAAVKTKGAFNALEKDRLIASEPLSLDCHAKTDLHPYDPHPVRHIAALTKAMIDSMVKHFTTEELKALADFYGSPVGKSAMQKFGAYMADIMPAIEAEIMKAQAKLNQSMPSQSPK